MTIFDKVKKSYRGHNHERLTWNDTLLEQYWSKVRGRPKKDAR
jgi:hypothetical protein